MSEFSDSVYEELPYLEDTQSEGVFGLLAELLKEADLWKEEDRWFLEGFGRQDADDEWVDPKWDFDKNFLLEDTVFGLDGFRMAAMRPIYPGWNSTRKAAGLSKHGGVRRHVKNVGKDRFSPWRSMRRRAQYFKETSRLNSLHK